MSNIVEAYLRMAKKKRITKYKKSGNMSYYQDVLLINFTKSIQDRQNKLNRKRRRTISETPDTEMVKRMKKIDEEMEEWKIKDAELPEPKRVFIPVNELDWLPLDALDGIEEAYAPGTLLSLQLAESFKDTSPIQKLKTVNNGKSIIRKDFNIPRVIPKPIKLKKTRRRDKLTTEIAFGKPGQTKDIPQQKCTDTKKVSETAKDINFWFSALPL